MNRYLLDTNVLFFLVTVESTDLSSDILSILRYYENQLYVINLTALLL